MHIPINGMEDEFLRTYYKPDISSSYFFTPFRTSSRQGRWLSPRYASTSGQSQRTKSDLASAFIHPRDSDEWGWAGDYIRVLRRKLERDRTGRIPTFWLAVFIFRDREWSAQTTAEQMVGAFVREFNINGEERNEIFQDLLPGDLDGPLLGDEPYSDARLLKIIEPPPDATPEEGGTLLSLELRGVGPSPSLTFNPSERLTIVTGDNGLGKTFLLECAWWSLTGRWADPEQPAFPRLDAPRGEASITFAITGKKRQTQQIVIKYDWDAQEWGSPKGRPTLPGLVVYARVDGSFAVWDPIRHGPNQPVQEGPRSLLLFSRKQVLDGLPGKIEGLLRDWVKWQHDPEPAVFDTFKSVLAKLSPPDMSPLVPAKAIRMANDPREIPTLSHPYGGVPFTQESAGIKRIATIAYLLVWAWNEHQIAARLVKREPQEKMVVLVDEMEAHLHPKWQRAILPALLEVTTLLSHDVESQLIVTTHSPMVLASVEPTFAAGKDSLFHLDLSPEGYVAFSPIPFVRHGTIDAWLTSDVFALGQARSREGERVIEKAKQLMANPNATSTEIRELHRLLAKAVPETDEFWPRWGYFAKRKGVAL
ncbi:MAG TPA: AAA family ATPase [Candidatus Limnocylindrales bacterium]|nr:AAA family ATPase [Candidatus Limnocylindrales bacterium]